MNEENIEQIIEQRLRQKDAEIILALQDGEEYVVTPEEYEAELEIYEAELLVIETERLRLKDLVDRINVLHDANYAHAVLKPDVPNAALYRKENILDNPNHLEAEDKLSALENKDTELKIESDKEQVFENRKVEYPSIEELVVALFEQDAVKIAELELKRQQVKSKYKKIGE